MSKFTDVFIRSVLPQSTAYTVREPGGFTLRVRPTGAKSWISVYDFAGTRYNFTLGQYPAMSLAAARKAHQTVRQQIAKGINPAAQKRTAKAQTALDALEPTVADLIREFTGQYKRCRQSTLREYTRQLNYDVLPALGNTKVKDVKRRDIALLIDRVASRGPVIGNRTLAAVRRLFSWAVERGLIEQSPVTQIKAPAVEMARDRVLSPEEIECFWKGLDAVSGNDLVKLALKLMLVTGQRKGEVLGAAWEEFDTTARIWTLPGNRTKNGRKHSVPLSDLAMDLLIDVKALSNGSLYLFPCQRAGNSSTIVGPTVTHFLRRTGLAPDFTPHDLRRTVATYLGELGFNRLVQDRVLNHVDPSVGGIYDRYDYTREARQALDSWSRKLQQVVTGNSNRTVVAFRGR